MERRGERKGRRENGRRERQSRESLTEGRSRVKKERREEGCAQHPSTAAGGTEVGGVYRRVQA